MNTLIDTIRVAEYFVSTGKTGPARILLEGRSSGGMNVAALANLRPDLFGVVASTVPLGDMICFPLLAWGNRWLYEYGDRANKDDFKALIKVSPYHQAQ